LNIPKGSVFGFLGPNGAGKTTTIKLLMDLIKPSAGTATVLGAPIGDVETKRKIGFLPDAPAFSPYLKANEFLNICAKLLRIPSSERKKRIEEVLEAVKMTEHARSKLGGFSRGMIQRIGIAQAILNRPELLILDEPLVGLDPHGRQELKNIISDQKKAGTNVFFCSHILSDVERMCDYIGILSKGRLLCSGKLEDLLSEKGIRVTLSPALENAARELLPYATESGKTREGGWKMKFDDNRELFMKIKKIKEDKPGEISVMPLMENLENFFFRLIENNE
jgi:ABC-2 type transport system ATP-binding protein